MKPVLLQYLSMGHYTSYIWSAYGLVMMVLIMNAIRMKWQQKRVRTNLQQWFTRISNKK